MSARPLPRSRRHAPIPWCASFFAALASCHAARSPGPAEPTGHEAARTSSSSTPGTPVRPAHDPIPDRSHDPTTAAAPDLAMGTDLLPEVLRFNSEAFAAPPRAFRPGHVTPRPIDPGRVDRSTGRFTVSLPSGAPVVTPAIHEGIVVTSGGFHSREMYAFRAQTGEPVWAIDLDDDGPSTPACQDRVCVFNTESCTVFAVSVQTGEMLWSWWLGDPLTSAPTVAAGKVFTSYPTQGATMIPQAAHAAVTTTTSDAGKAAPPGQSHALAAFDLHTGELVWTRWIDSDVISAPVAVGDAVYVTTFHGSIYKFAADDGDILAARRARATSAPVIDGGDVYYTQRTDDPDGPVSEAVARSNAETKSRAYVTASKRAVYLDSGAQARTRRAAQGKSLDASNGFSGGAPTAANAKAAEANVGQSSVSTMQAYQGSWILRWRDLSLSTMGDEVVATDAATGTSTWRFEIPGNLADAGGWLATPPLAAGGSVLVGTLSGQVVEIDPTRGNERRSFDLGTPIRSQPIVSEGWIYVGTEDGKLMGIDTGDPSLTGWTHWGKNAARTGR